MSSAIVDNHIPQWKKDLIARLRSQNRRTAGQSSGGNYQQLGSSSVQQPGSVATVAAARCDVSSSSVSPSIMVQDRAWEWDKCVQNGHKISDDEEDLRYGPGIVKKLKNRYLSLAERDNKARASILTLRKATSLENILDGDDADGGLIDGGHLFEKRVVNGGVHTKNVPNRFRNGTRNGELKRARSVETISSLQVDTKEVMRSKRESLNEEVLIIATEGSAIIPDKMLETTEKSYSTRVNRPLRIPPVMSAKEKPPVDVVNKAKMIFEKRPTYRTKAPLQTGEVAAKVANFKNIINQTKASKKPPIKMKPILVEKPKTNGVYNPPPSPKSPLPSPIPDVSKVEVKSPSSENDSSTSLCETPDLLITSSPLSQSFRITSTEKFIKEEVRLSALHELANKTTDEDAGVKKLTMPMNLSNSITFNFAKAVSISYQPPNSNALDTQKSIHQPLKVETNGIHSPEPIKSPPKQSLTSVEIEKNRKNAAKSERKSVIVNNKSDEKTPVVKVPKLKKPNNCNGNTMVFNFKGQDIPDYVHNDGRITVIQPERPKAGEGGIILLPGASISESFTDEEEEIMRSLDRPPSPCDVTFINDNILIDGKSSLSQKSTKRPKLKISFVSEEPEVYEYLSEDALLVESPSSPLRPSVPSLTGASSLATYTPKSAEEFHLGVSRSVQNPPPLIKPTEVVENHESEFQEPILFSAGANSDILF